MMILKDWKRGGFAAVLSVASWALLIFVVVVLGACASHAPQPYVQDPDIVYPVYEPPAAGAIAAPGQGLFLFEDAKARNVGDLLTISLVEQTVAQKSASTNTSKDNSLDIGAGTVFTNPIDSLSSLSAGQSFSGAGDSSQSNKLEGELTVNVVQRLPNGNLVVRGEKQLRLNQGSEIVRIEGVVRPQDIGADNTVTSDRVANARITYAGRGALADANAQGWVARFFNSPWFPF